MAQRSGLGFWVACGQNREIWVTNFCKGVKAQGQDFALKLDLAGDAHQDREQGSALCSSSWCRKAFPFTSHTASSPTAGPPPLRKPSRSQGAPIFSYIHPTFHRSSSSLLFLHLSGASPWPILCSGPWPTFCTLRAFQLSSPRSCRLSASSHQVCIS